MVWLLLPMALGALAVLQGGLNRHIGGAWGLSPAVVWNNVVIFVAGLAFLGWAKFKPDSMPAMMQIKDNAFTNFSWWYVLPGLFGFCLVAFIPYSMARIGAAQTFVGLVVAQMVVALVWDATTGASPVTTARLVGTALAAVGVFVASR